MLEDKMSFEQWSDLLFMRAKLMPETTSGERAPWRCTGCGQLMYGLEWEDGKSFPSPYDTPAGLFISKEYPHVCHVCWEMYHAIELSPSGYWQRLDAANVKTKKQLGSGGDYLFT